VLGVVVGYPHRPRQVFATKIVQFFTAAVYLPGRFISVADHSGFAVSLLIIALALWGSATLTLFAANLVPRGLHRTADSCKFWSCGL
jgi:hypothetical protein